MASASSGECPSWCTADHTEELADLSEYPGLLHRSTPVRVPSEHAHHPYTARAEAWLDRDGGWHEVVSVGLDGQDGTQLTPASAVQLAEGLAATACLLPTLAEDREALRRALRLPAGDPPRAVRVRRVSALPPGCGGAMSYRDDEALVLTLPEAQITAEAAAGLERMLAILLTDPALTRRED
jgi:hypothetical protein